MCARERVWKGCCWATVVRGWGDEARGVSAYIPAHASDRAGRGGPAMLRARHSRSGPTPAGTSAVAGAPRNGVPHGASVEDAVSRVAGRGGEATYAGEIPGCAAQGGDRRCTHAICCGRTLLHAHRGRSSGCSCPAARILPSIRPPHACGRLQASGLGPAFGHTCACHRHCPSHQSAQRRSQGTQCQ